MSNQTTGTKESPLSSPKASKRGQSRKPKSAEPSKEESLKPIQVATHATKATQKSEPLDLIQTEKWLDMTMGPERSNNIEIWKSLGFKCKYARFHNPTPRAMNEEPVSEFYLQKQDPPLSSQIKYTVDEMWFTPMGFIWSSKGEIDNVMALPSVVFVRPK